VTFRHQKPLSPIHSTTKRSQRPQHYSERHKQTFATRDHKDEKITSALGEKSSFDNDADGETLPDKKKAAA
jgi:hypothetical protein